MNLNHLNLCVNNLTEARDFFSNLFDFKLSDQKGDVIAVMTDRTGFTLVLQSNSKKVYTYPKDFHLGFYVETKSDVDQFYTKLVEANIPTENEPGIVRNGYTLYFTALGGILFEVTCFSL